MSAEVYPLKERQATDPDTTISWVAQEVAYGRDKVKGYREKLIRLERDPGDNTSVFGFMSVYWGRVNAADAQLRELPRPIMASRALQAYAKVVAGITDKVVFAQWLLEGAQPVVDDPQRLIDMALDSVRARIGETVGRNTDESLLGYVGRPFEENPLGQTALALHHEHEVDPSDAAILRVIALEGSALGFLMLHAYARNLESQGFSVELPKPGVSSGNIEPWV